MIGFNFSNILNVNGKERAKILGRMSQNVKLCKKYKATEYISGIGAKSYLQPELFEKENIKVTYQKGLIRKPLFEILNEQ